MSLYLQNLIRLNKPRVKIAKQGTLDCSSPKFTEAINGLKIELKEHQKTLLQACLELEDTSQKNTHFNNFSYQSNVGIIGDTVGSGKSISALSLIVHKPTLNNYRFPNEFLHYNQMGVIVYQDSYIDNKIQLNANLIIVPHSIILQWERYIKTHTNLDYMKVNTTKSCCIKIDTLLSVQVILVSTNFLGELLESIKSILEFKEFIFQRIFIDEADNIKITGGKIPLALFHWFITSSVENLLFPGGSYYEQKDNNELIGYNNTKLEYIKGLKFKNYITHLFVNLREMSLNSINVFNKICCKNSNPYIEQSFQLPKPKYNAYLCRTPPELRLFNKNIHNMEELSVYINANDINALKEKLGFKVESKESISQMLTHNLRRNLNNEEKHYEYIKNLEIDNVDKKERLEKIQKKINEISDSLQYVEDRLKINGENICPICRDTLTEPICNTVCCGNMFCLNCITCYFNSSIGKIGECPCCRTKIGFDGITIVSDKVNTDNLSSIIELINKEELFIKLVMDSADDNNRKWLIFSSFDGSFEGLIKKLIEKGITFSKICGTVSHIDRVINDFKNGSIKVLLLNALHFGMGLNLEMATDILIYHQLKPEIENQVVGRAQRPGRNSTLRVHMLCHENEYNSYKDRIIDLEKREITVNNLENKIIY
jgi:hypothetical protein